jgi:hypothetical protein
MNTDRNIYNSYYFHINAVHSHFPLYIFLRLHFIIFPYITTEPHVTLECQVQEKGEKFHSCFITLLNFFFIHCTDLRRPVLYQGFEMNHSSFCTVFVNDSPTEQHLCIWNRNFTEYMLNQKYKFLSGKDSNQTYAYTRTYT